ncbi:hypothetical protein EVAR_22530_1 [Eumeta japonica]|uniref:Fasciculation and elongation protein zeta-2 n=1 Tax=Eumeta variegata TaxID=151549 RepID=A0A4C1U8J5_EUMVA|nr:hypothetical protein EVAR_22530_1 [Eumeta japonica]
MLLCENERSRRLSFMINVASKIAKKYKARRAQRSVVGGAAASESGSDSRRSTRADVCVMRVVDACGRMAELELEAPLAQLEDVDDLKDNGNDPLYGLTRAKDPPPARADTNIINDNDEAPSLKIAPVGVGGPQSDNFTETFSGSLEDLVNTFDEKITKCFGNYEENVEKLAPVQVRTQEEIMSECHGGASRACGGAGSMAGPGAAGTGEGAPPHTLRPWRFLVRKLLFSSSPNTIAGLLSARVVGNRRLLF